jgi:hypothetical protein
MAVSVRDRQVLIVTQLAATGADTTILYQHMPVVWARYTDRDTIYPFLTDLYVTRRCIELLLPGVRTKVDKTSADQKDAYFQQMTGLLQMAADTTAEIVRIEARARASRAGVLTPITATAPVAPPPAAQTDANDPAYGGSPYKEFPSSVGGVSDTGIPNNPQL